LPSRNRALIYIRKSIVRTGSDTISPERQRARCLEEAERHGWIVEPGDVFEDAEGHMSGRTDNRPDWQRLQRRIRQDQTVVAVVVESLARASRSVRDFFEFLAGLQGRQIALVSLKERFDTSSAMGMAMMGFVAVVNQLESDLASERMKDQIAFKRSRGRHWGLTPFGCERAPVTGALSPSTETYSVDGNGDVRRYYDALVRCYELYAPGDLSLSRLATALNAAGWRFRGRKGEPRRFDASNVRTILMAHRLYQGWIPVSGHIKDGPKEWIPGNFDPILPEELCAAVERTLERRAREWTHPTPPARAATPPSDYILTGIVYCAGCGAKLKGFRQRGKRYYRHHQAKGACPERYSNADAIEATVLGLMAGLRLPTTIVQDVTDLLSGGLVDGPGEEIAAEIADVDRSLLRVQSEMQRLVQLAIATDLNSETYTATIRTLNGEAEELRRRHLELEGLVYHSRVDLEDVVRQLNTVFDALNNQRPDLQRKLLQSVIERVDIGSDRVVSWEPRAWCKPFF